MGVLLFYPVCGITATRTQALAAISGVLGAYLLLFPRAHRRTDSARVLDVYGPLAGERRADLVVRAASLEQRARRGRAGRGSAVSSPFRRLVAGMVLVVLFKPPVFRLFSPLCV